VDNTGKTRPSLRRLYRLGMAALPVAWLSYRLGLRSATQHGNVVAAVRQYQALRRGLWFYGVLLATKP